MKPELYKRILSSLFLLPVVFFIIFMGSTLFTIFLIFTFFLALHEWYKLQKNIFLFIIGIIFLILSFYSAYLLRGYNDLGLIYFSLAISICIFTDIGGYIFGKIFKGPKLTKISPNKTLSGSLGSYFLSSLFVYIYFTTQEYRFTNLLNLDYLDLLIITLSISTISQFGDLIISFFKRKSKIKDTGQLIPGHGGLLDRIDGILFAIPFSLILTKII